LVDLTSLSLDTDTFIYLDGEWWGDFLGDAFLGDIFLGDCFLSFDTEALAADFLGGDCYFLGELATISD